MPWGETKEIQIPVTLTGSAGSASGNGQSGAGSGSTVVPFPVRGWLEAIILQYNGQPATTVVAVSEVGGLARTFLTISAANTDGVWYPRYQAAGPTGAAIAGVYVRAWIAGLVLKVAVSSGNAGIMTARLFISEV